MILEYDKIADILYISFHQSKYVTCIEKGGHVLTCIDPISRRVVGFTIMAFAKAAAALETLELPFVEDEPQSECVREIIRRSMRQLKRKGRLSFRYNPRVSFSPSMARVIEEADQWPDVE